MTSPRFERLYGYGYVVAVAQKEVVRVVREHPKLLPHADRRPPRGLLGGAGGAGGVLVDQRGRARQQPSDAGEDLRS